MNTNIIFYLIALASLLVVLHGSNVAAEKTMHKSIEDSNLHDARRKLRQVQYPQPQQMYNNGNQMNDFRRVNRPLINRPDNWDRVPYLLQTYK